MGFDAQERDLSLPAGPPSAWLTSPGSRLGGGGGVTAGSQAVPDCSHSSLWWSGLGMGEEVRKKGRRGGLPAR